MAGLEIPERCGVILLPDCTLFPHGGLPLRIFEPRYRRMLEDALEKDCFFAVARLTGQETSRPGECTSSTGTIGLVRASKELEDGTSQLLLHGVLRVRFTHWHSDEPYPSASIEPRLCVPVPDGQAKAAMRTLRGAVEDAIQSLPAEVRNGVLSVLDRADSPEIMTDVVSQQFIHDSELRQQLLETDSIGARIPILCAYLGGRDTGN